MNKTEPTYAFCIQGKDTATGKRGSFLYTNSEPFKAISPVFDSLVELFAWFKVNGYETEKHVVSYRVFKTERN